MSIVYLLIPLGLMLLALCVWAFFWAVRSGQFDDLDTPALQILLDDDRAPPPDDERSPDA
jgi:cbb3-type cytochrome oxidase maturation protein